MRHAHGKPPILDEEGRCAICGEEVVVLSSRNLDEAVINIRMALGRIGIYLGRGNSDLEEVAADIEQAVRFLTGEEEPS